MKQLLTIIISLQLIALPLPAIAQSSNNVSTPEMAIENPDIAPGASPQKKEEKKTESEKQNDSAENNIAEASNIGTDPAYDARSQGGAGYQGFAKQILGASTAIIGSNIITSCSFGGKVPSILAFMGGSIAYLISEIAGGKKQNEEHKKRLERIEQIKAQVAENKGGGDVQRQLIEQRLEEEEKILEFVKERNKWGMAIMAIYTVAAGLAIAEEMGGMSAGTGIGMTTCASLAAQYASPCGIKYPACYAKHLAACTPVQPAGQMAAKAAFMSPTSVAIGTSACSATALYAPACMANMKAYLAIAYANCMPISMGNIAVAGISGNLFSAAYGLGFSYADSGNLQSLLQLAVTLTNMFTTALSTKITALYSYPIPRAATFGAHAALMGVIIAGLDKVAKQTEDNITKLRKVVEQFRNTTDDINGFKQGGQLADAASTNLEIDEYQAGSPGAISLKNKNVNAMKGLAPITSNSKTCFSNDKGQMEIGSAACTKSVNVRPIAVKIKQGTNKNLETGVSLINDLNRALEKGNMDAARAISSDLASMSTALREDLKKAQDDYNKKLAKKDKIDFAAEEKKVMDSLEEGKKGIIDSFAREQGIKLASLSPSSGLVGLDDSTDSSATQNINESSAAESISLTNGTDQLKNGNSEDAIVSEGYFTPYEAEGTDLLFGGAIDSANPMGLNEDAYRAANANGYLDLHGKRGYANAEGIAASKENLFKVISNRYFLSYPKFMQRKIVENKKTE